MRKSAPQQRLLTARCAGLSTAAAFLLANAEDPQAASPVPLDPNGKWNVNHADVACTLARDFGTAPDRLVFAAILAPGTNSVTLVVQDFGTNRGSLGAAVMQISAPPAPLIQTQGATGAPAEGGGRVTRATVERSEFDRLRTATNLTFVIDGKVRTIRLTGTSAAFKALAACETTQLQKLGLDPDRVARIKIRPAPVKMWKWIYPTDYPPNALWAGVQGQTRVMFIVDATGKVANCAIALSSGSTDLDKVVCARIAPRARFTPAQDEAGVAVPSVWTGAFGFRIP